MKFFIKLCLLFFFIVSCYYEPNSNINSNRLNEIDNLINSFIDDNQIPGAVVLVGDNKNILYQKSFGIKNPITNDKYQINDIFRRGFFWYIYFHFFLSSVIYKFYK